MGEESFDRKDPVAIEKFGKRLVNSSVGQQIAVRADKDRPKKGDKGGVGVVVEEYFGISRNSDSSPDFPEAGVELKTSPLKKYRGGTIDVKERLSLNMIDFFEMYEERWATSKFLKKNQLLMLVFYLWEKAQDPYSARIDLASLWTFPKADLQRIKQDWELIHKKISEGKAHLLSEGDTWYLGAATKGSKKSLVEQPRSKTKAPKRALALKQKYIREIYAALKAGKRTFQSGGLTDETEILARVLSFKGERVDKIAESLNFVTKAKHRWGLITKRAAGIGAKESAALRRANIEIRTVRVFANGKLHESFPFRAMSFGELVEGDWFDSELYQLLTTRIMFVVYEGEVVGREVLKGAFFWTMPFADIERFGREAWQRTRSAIKDNNPALLPKESERGVVYVNTHGRDSTDIAATPGGLELVKRSFWLSKAYLEPIIRKALS